MSKTSRILLGLATIVPMIYTIAFICFFFASFLLAVSGGDPPENAPAPLVFPVFFVLNLLMMPVGIGLAIFYILHVMNNVRLDQEKRVLWTIFVLMGGFVGMPVYWFLYIWRDPS